MYKCVYFFLVVVAAKIHAEHSEINPENAQRMLIASMTQTIVYMSATTIPTTVARTCFVTNTSVSACRRRRGIEEKPMVIFKDVDLISVFASKPLAVEPTARALLEPFAAESAAKTQVHSSLEAVEADVIGLSGSLEPRSPFFARLTIRYTTFSTLTLTSYSTITSGSKNFTMAGCTPIGFSYSAC